MTQHVVSVHPGVTLAEVISLLLRHRVSGMPVTDDNGELIGVISEYDLLKAVYEPELTTAPVRDHMTTEVVTVSLDASLVEVTDTFISTHLRRLLVVDGGTLAGVISRHDLVRFVRDTRQRVASAIARRGSQRTAAEPNPA